MNVYHEAAEAAASFEGTRAVSIRMELAPDGVHFVAYGGGKREDRKVNWAQIEASTINVLLATVTMLANKFPPTAVDH